MQAISIAKRLSAELSGKTIKSIESLSEKEVSFFEWYCDPEETIVVIFTDNTCALVTADPEGNGPGFLELGEVLSNGEVA